MGDEPSGVGEPADDRTCLGETHQAEVVGLDIFVMLDISASMGEALPRTLPTAAQTKWDAVKQSLQAFVQAPESSGIGMGLQYFPQQREGVPDACTSNEDCGVGGPCSASVCVGGFFNNDPQNPLAFIGPTNPNCQGDECVCSSDAECGGEGEGSVCRAMLGICIVPGQGIPPGLPVPPLCNSDADCGGLPGTACDVLGVCDAALARGQATFCLSTLGCAAADGSCVGFPNTCLGQTLCEAEPYATPAVPISSDATRANIITSLDAVQLQGLTPTGPALQGALDHARAWALEHPDRQVVTVFATDGLPTECTPQEGPEIAQLAADANSGDVPVRTFVIGVFGSADLGNGRALLDELASAGGSEQAFVINTGADVGAEFLQALNQIRDTAVSCEFQLDGGAALDFDRVNLRISDAAGAVEELSNVGDVGACGGDQGWYYVRNAGGTPTQIQVCPSTCTRLTTTSGISAELEVGCATRIR